MTKRVKNTSCLMETPASVLTPSLGYVDDGYDHLLAVVHPSEQKELFMKHIEMAAPPVVPEMATANEMLDFFVDISELMGNALMTSSQTVHDSVMNVIVHKLGQLKQYVDEKMIGVEQKMVGVEQKVAQLEKRLSSLENPRKSKKSKTK